MRMKTNRKSQNVVSLEQIAYTSLHVSVSGRGYNCRACFPILLFYMSLFS